MSKMKMHQSSELKMSHIGILLLSTICSLRPWDPMNDLIQYENDFVIQTKTRHRTPIVRTTSITNVDESNRHGTGSVAAARVARIKRASIKHLARSAAAATVAEHEHESGSSSPDGDGAGGLRLRLQEDSDSSLDDGAYYITHCFHPHRTHTMISRVFSGAGPLQTLCTC